MSALSKSEELPEESNLPSKAAKQITNAKEVPPLHHNDEESSEQVHSKDDIVKNQPIRTAPAARVMENLLGSTLKCTLDDGRVVTGNLLAIDRLKNIILAKAVEKRQTDPAVYTMGESSTLGDQSTFTVTRHLSQAMIPGKHLVRVEVEQATYDLHVQPIVVTQNEP